ncbi:MAG: glycosyltransferase family 2 protein [Lachnospiraceae bacterium]|nr:glycosyltransferase family 2 protein [Lachnospiraceae bacterium]
MDSLCIVMPAYNEKDNIEGVIKTWYPVLQDKADNSRLIIADGGSQDETHDILLKLKKEYPKLEIVSDTLKQHGPKVIALYKYAISMGADFVFQTDSDGQTNPKEFADFWDDRHTYSGQFGNRTVRGDGKGRAFVEKVVCMLLRLYYGVRIPDANAPFRLMNVDVLKKYINMFDEDYNLPNIMLTTFWVYFKEEATFKEISFKPRTAGKNSVNFRKIFKIGIKALTDFKILKKRMKEYNK